MIAHSDTGWRASAGPEVNQIEVKNCRPGENIATENKSNCFLATGWVSKEQVSEARVEVSQRDFYFKPIHPPNPPFVRRAVSSRWTTLIIIND